MPHPVIGWESADPVPSGHAFTPYLRAAHGRLFWHGLDLGNRFLGQEQPTPLPSPLELVYLPAIGQQIAHMRHLFATIGREVGYEGAFHYAYASKANAAEEVIRTTLQAGAHHEMSSSVDVEIAQLMIVRGLLTAERWVIANGFKAAHSDYAQQLLQLRQSHDNLLPVIEDLGEIAPLILSKQPFEVGLRLKSYSTDPEAIKTSTADSRFGLSWPDLRKAADYIKAAPTLTLKLFHAMVGGQITDVDDFVARLEPTMSMYAQLKRSHPALSIFNFGGGVPVAMTLDFDFDYAALVRSLLTTMQSCCQRYQVPVPDIMGEFGRYTTAQHGAHLFKIVTAKDNESPHPWYIINGSIMSSFPDSWALGEHFIVLPLNHLDQPFQQVRLGGITCDSDDIYPPRGSTAPLYLPVETDELHIGFFNIGAYQEMLGGVRGSKHCVLPEAPELIVDVDEAGQAQFQLLEGQKTAEVLRNLGYQTPATFG